MKRYFKLRHLLTLLIVMFLNSKLALAANSEEVVNSDNQLFVVLLSFIIVLLIIILILGGVIKSIGSNKEIWKNHFDKTKTIAILIAFSSLIPTTSSASTGIILFIMSNTVFYLLIGIIVILFLIALSLARVLQKLLNQLSGKKKETPFITQFTENLTDAVPIEREEEILTDHEYDGIRELDNVLPPWWVYLFYITIIFSFVYIVKYHVMGTGDVMAEEYQAEVELAEMQRAKLQEANPSANITEDNVELITESGDLARGKNIFNASCASCHLESGGGNIGPNLTDEYWIHGGGIKDIFKTIKYGVTGKMVSWESMIKPEDMQRVASYVLSLQGSNPPNPKAPEGELYVPEDGAATNEADSTMNSE